jgi:hypothetical protein
MKIRNGLNVISLKDKEQNCKQIWILDRKIYVPFFILRLAVLLKDNYLTAPVTSRVKASI